MDIRAELAALREEQATYLDRRHAIVDKAREAGMTWREIADILGMTQHGLIKAHQR